MEKYDVVAMGELLIDFTQNGYSEQGNPIFEANPGGAPCNVLAMLQKLGRKTAFIGKVGQDGFGLQLEKALKEIGISTEGLCFGAVVSGTGHRRFGRCAFGFRHNAGLCHGARNGRGQVHNAVQQKDENENSEFLWQSPRQNEIQGARR